MINAAILKRLAALQLAPEAMQEVLSIIASCIEPLEQRRRRDRDRKSRGKSTENPQNVRGISPEIPAETPPMHILSPQEESSKAKKPSRSTSIEVPDRPTEHAINFAVSHRWELPKIQSEWQRFRDHSLAKGKRHRNVDAAWRNWVTSPYQANGAANGERSSARKSNGASDFFAGLASVAADIGGDGDLAGSADADIPTGRVNIEH